MYTIYMGSRRIIIGRNGDHAVLGDLSFSVNGSESKAEFRKLITLCEEAAEDSTLLLLSDAPSSTWQCFNSVFEKVTAAGGLVHNSEGDLLMIFRNEKWDLPKGKVDDGESLEQTALREVSEECGVQQLTILRQADTTYHIYQSGSEKILKYTYWYYMQCHDPANIKPQAEEGITAVKWVSVGDLRRITEITFASIRNLLQKEGLLQ